MNEKIIEALRKNDESEFVQQLDDFGEPIVFAGTNSVHFANWFSGVGLTLLQLTVFVRPNFVKHLIDRGVEIDLFSACALGDAAAIERWLDEIPNAFDQEIDSYFPIQFALRSPEALKKLLSRGDNPNRSLQKMAWFEWEDQATQRGYSDWRPMHMLALGRGDEPHLESAEVLRVCGADLNASSRPFGLAPIHVAAIYDRANIVRWLVDNECDVDSRTRDAGVNLQSHGLFDTEPFAPFFTRDQTPLMVALAEGQKNAVEMLLQLGADVNAQDSNGFTPLHYASAPFWQESPTLIDTLLSHGASPTAKSYDEKRPIDLAAEKNYNQTVTLLSTRSS